MQPCGVGAVENSGAWLGLAAFDRLPIVIHGLPTARDHTGSPGPAPPGGAITASSRAPGTADTATGRGC